VYVGDNALTNESFVHSLGLYPKACKLTLAGGLETVGWRGRADASVRWISKGFPSGGKYQFVDNDLAVVAKCLPCCSRM
jgi:hypothetical protein